MVGDQEQRHVYYDSDLNIEVYQLCGIVQKFPNHFHEYYVVGFIEGGRRHRLHGRIFRPEPFHPVFQTIYRADAKAVPEYISRRDKRPDKRRH